MIRSTTPNDTIALIAIADASGLFQPNQLDEIGEMLTITSVATAATAIISGLPMTMRTTGH